MEITLIVGGKKCPFITMTKDEAANATKEQIEVAKKALENIRKANANGKRGPSAVGYEGLITRVSTTRTKDKNEVLFNVGSDAFEGLIPVTQKTARARFAVYGEDLEDYDIRSLMIGGKISFYVQVYGLGEDVVGPDNVETGEQYTTFGYKLIPGSVLDPNPETEAELLAELRATKRMLKLEKMKLELQAPKVRTFARRLDVVETLELPDSANQD